MIKLFFFHLHFMLFFPCFDIFFQSSESFLLIKRLFSHCFNSHFQLTYFLIFKITFTVSFIKIRNELSEFFLFSFDINVVSLKVFILLFAKNNIEFIVQASDCLIYIVFCTLKLLPSFWFVDAPFLCGFSLYFLHPFRNKLESKNRLMKIIILKILTLKLS